MNNYKKKLIISITGASGAIYAIELLRILKQLAIETHLVISKAAYITINAETDYSINKIKNLASFVYKANDITAPISSGSFITAGMLIVPCSMKTLSEIAHSYEYNLIVRAASVTIKEHRKLSLMVRESPLHMIHIQNMLKLSKCGVIINPAIPAFYNKPKTIQDIVLHSVVRMLDPFNIRTDLIKRWNGLS